MASTVRPHVRTTAPPRVFENMLATRRETPHVRLYDEEHAESVVSMFRVFGTACGLRLSWHVPFPLCDFDDLPEWIKDNHHLRSCHRVNLTLKQACKSSLYLHNETGNIWTHLIAAVVSLWMWPWAGLDMSTTEEYVIMSLFFFGSTAVYTLSALFHIFFVCSPTMKDIWARVDYFGIVCGIWGGEMSTVIAMFPCSWEKFLYGSLISLLAVLCAIVVLDMRTHHPRFRLARTLLFCVFGLFGVVPSAHLLLANHHWFAHDATTDAILPPLLFLAAEGAFFLGGAALYAAQVPERWWPGMFDVVGHSHQVWHVAIIFGFCSNYFMLRGFIDNKDVLFPQCVGQA